MSILPPGSRLGRFEMLRGGYNLGGEQSGHIIFLYHTTTGDGIISALQILKTMIMEGKPLSELSKVMTTFPQILLNVKVREKKDLALMPSVAGALKNVEDKLKGRGRAFIRYSGTEPLARITIEGEEQKEITAMANELAELLAKELG